MSLSDLNPRHLRLISLYSTRYAVRGGTGIVYLLLVLTFGLVLAQTIISPIEQLQARLKKDHGADIEVEKLLDEIIDNARPMVEWFLTEGSEDDPDEVVERHQEEAEKWSRYLLDERPAMLSAIFLLMLFGLPLLVAMGCFNQYSGDVGSRGIRYHLMRTERVNIYFGRFLGAALYSVVVMFFLILTIVLYIGFKMKIYEWDALLMWSLWGFFGLSVLTFPYVALAGWISALIDSQFGSLTITSLIVGGVPMLAALGKYTYDEVEYVKYLIPWGVQNQLLHVEGARVALAAVACLFYTAFFLALGYRHFSKRDL